MVTATVDVKSAWTSKVNWISGLFAVAAALSSTTDMLQQLLPFVPANDQHYLTLAIVLLGGIATIITRTFFTTAITKSSAKGTAAAG